jgi:hypothetical protein
MKIISARPDYKSHIITPLPGPGQVRFLLRRLPDYGILCGRPLIRENPYSQFSHVPPYTVSSDACCEKARPSRERGIKMRTRIALFLLLSAGIVAGTGCSTTVINPGTKTTAVYRFGKLTSNISTDINTSYKATEAAMQELGLNVVQRVKDQLEAKVVARDAQDKKIVVRLVGVTDEATKLVVDVDSLAKARRIYQAILDNMPKA